MAKVLITESTLEDIADAIRAKANTNRTYKPSEMAAAINNLEDEEHQPAHINIAQTNNQTITVNANLFSASEVQTEHTTSFTVNVPSSVQLNASVVPDTGYTAGELNITNTTVGWDSTVSFSASPATEASQATLSFELEETSSGPYDTDDIITYKLTSSKIGTGTVELVEAYCASADDKWLFSDSGQTTGSYAVTEDDILNGNITLTFVNYETGDTLTELIIDNLAEPNGHLTVTASANEPYTFAVGENVNFNVVLTNDGNLTITDVALQSEETGDYWVWESLAPGQSIEETAEYWPTEEDVSAGAVNIIFTAKGSSPDPDNPDVDVTNAEVTVGTEEPVTHTVTFTLNVTPVSDASIFTNLSFSLDGQTVVLDPYNDVSIQVSDGYSYDISFPRYSGYTVTPDRITGICVNDIHFTITYERNDGNFTLLLKDMNSMPMSASYSGTVGNVPISGTANGRLVLNGYYGDSFSVNFVAPSGYTLNQNPVTGTLSNRTITVIFTPTGGGTIPDYDTEL